jgi:hypothetical protein
MQANSNTFFERFDAAIDFAADQIKAEGHAPFRVRGAVFSAHRSAGHIADISADRRATTVFSLWKELIDARILAALTASFQRFKLGLSAKAARIRFGSRTCLYRVFLP